MSDELTFASQEWEGWGTDRAKQVEDLVKALTAQEGVTDYATLRGGGALMPQSLEATLAMLTFQDKHIVFWKDIGVQKAYSTVEEYTKNEGYGTEGGFVQQMENPEEDDPELARGTLQIKFLRTLWRVGDVMTQVRTVTNAEVVAVQAAMMRMLRNVERGLFFGNHAMIPESWDGLAAAIAATGSTANAIDMRGAALSETMLKQGSETIFVNYGTPSAMYISPATQTSLDNLLQGANFQRVLQNQIGPTGSLTLGMHVSAMNTNFGSFGFKPDIFLGIESQGVPVVKNMTTGVIQEGSTSLKAPAMPVVSVAPVAGAIAGSLWSAVAGDSGGRIAGKYIFRVAAVNRFGKSRACAALSATVAATGAFSVTITEGGGTFTATSYEIYSTKIPSTTVAACRLQTMIAYTAATQTWRDLNAYLPGCAVAFLVDNTTVGEMRTMAFKQLTPIHRVEYAKINPSRWGAIQLYGAPVFYAPLRMIMYYNIGVGTPARNENLDL